MFYQEIEINEKKIRGFLQKHEKQEELVIMLHGFSGNKNDHHFMFRTYANAILNEGYDVVRFDFLGSGDSDGVFEDISINSQCKQCDAIIKHYQKAYKKIHLWGFSLGGVVAALEASKWNCEIASLFLLSPAFLLQEVMERILATSKKVLAGYDMTGFLVPDEFLEEVKNLNLKSLNTYQGELKIVIGNRDQYIDLEKVIKVSSKYQQKIEYIEVDQADHCYSSIDLTKRVVEEMISFYRRK